MPTLDVQRFGTDIELPADPDAVLALTPTGDLRTVSGLANVRAANQRRLLTERGSLLWRPDYGTVIPSSLEQASTPASRSAMANDARRALLSDPRNKDVTVTVAEGRPTDPGASAVTLSLSVVYRDESQETLTVHAEA